MDKLTALNFEIENYQKQMQILFLVASQAEKDKMLEELKELLDQRDELTKEQNNEP